MRAITGIQWATGAFLVCVVTWQAVAQPLQTALERLEAPEPSSRMRAFYELVAQVSRDRPPRTGWKGPRTDLLVVAARADDRVAVSLIRLLERENSYIASTPLQSLSHDYTTVYHADLFEAVAELRDLRALKALLPTLRNGDVVISGVAALGEPAVPELLRALHDSNAQTRSGTAHALRKMIEGKLRTPLREQSIAAIRAALLQAVRSDPGPFVRVAAIRGLIQFDGEDIRLEMQRLAAADTARVRMGDNRPGVFIVREAAAQWLAKHP